MIIFATGSLAENHANVACPPNRFVREMGHLL